MITITITIQQKENELYLRFAGNDDGGCTDLEANVADDFKSALSGARDRIYEKYGFNEAVTERNKYMRSFMKEEDRNDHYDNEQERG